MFTEKTILVPFGAESRRKAVTMLVDALVRAGRVPPHREDDVVKAVLSRERLGSTYVADGLALPHAAIENFEGVVGCLGVSRGGLRWDSGPERAHFVCLLISSRDDYSKYLAALKSVAGLFGGDRPGIGKDLLLCATPAEALEMLSERTLQSKVREKVIAGAEGAAALEWRGRAGTGRGRVAELPRGGVVSPRLSCWG